MVLQKIVSKNLKNCVAQVLFENDVQQLCLVEQIGLTLKMKTINSYFSQPPS